MVLSGASYGTQPYIYKQCNIFYGKVQALTGVNEDTARYSFFDPLLSSYHVSKCQVTVYK